MRKIWLVVLAPLLLVSASVINAQVYKTVDAQGNITYSDKPKGDASHEVQLREVNTISAPTTTPSARGPSVSVTSHQAEQAFIDYQIAIISPRDEVILPVGQRDLAIAVAVTPALAENHLLVYFLNGELLEETSSPSIIVQDVPRGIHTIVVEAIDAQGRSLGVSAPVKVNLMRPRPPRPTPR